MDTFDITPTGANRKTMSSLEIAELTGKDHKNVIRDIRAMCAGLKIEPSIFGRTYKDVTGRRLICFYLPRRECLVLVSGYDVALRAKIIDRWEELERDRLAGRAVDPMAMLNDPSAMRGILLSYTEKVIALEGEVAEMRPQVDALDRIANSEGSLCVTDTAKTLQVQPKALFQFLRSHRWIYARAGTSHEVAYQDKLAHGLLEHKTTTVYRSDGSEKTATQVRVTPKGLARLAVLFPPVARAA